MKSSIFSLAFVAGLVAAQSGKLPSCATECVTKYTTGSGIADCKQVDVKCICSNSQFLDGIACCLDASCDAAGKAEAVKYAQQICSTAGVSVPDEVVCKNPAGDLSSTASASGAASETASDSASKSTGAATATGTGSAATTTGGSTSTKSVAPAATSNAAMGVNGASGLLGAVMAMLVAL